MTSPEGLREVLGQNTYSFVKPHLLRAMVGKILGHGLLLSEGDIHKVRGESWLYVQGTDKPRRRKGKT